MKRFIGAILLLTMCASVLLTAVSCGSNDVTKLDVGFMSGPTGMGMAKLIQNNGGVEGNEKYKFYNYEDKTDNAMADLIAGDVDIVCVPTNLAASFYNKNGGITVLAVNCLNSLYVVTDKSITLTSFDELEGQTVYTCLSGTPKAILEHALAAAGVNATVSTSIDGETIDTPKELGELVQNGSLPIAAMPEPIITSALLAIQKAGNTDIAYSIDLNVADAWSEGHTTPITMGCIVAKTDFVNQNKAAIDSFLADYKASVEYVGDADNLGSAANYVVESGIMGALPAAKKALGNLGGAIAYIDGADMKSALVAFYEAIGITLPADAFYYEK